MKWRELLREACRNFATGSSHGILSLLLFFVLSLVLGVAATSGVVHAAGTADRFEAAGASTFRFDAPGAIDGEACDALSIIPGISASGSTRRAGFIRFALLPAFPVSYFDATPGMLQMLEAAPAAPRRGIIIENDLVHELGMDVESATVASRLADGSSVEVAAGFAHPDDGRDPTFNGAALGVTLDDAPFDSCWARFWPPSEDPGSILRSTAPSVGGGGEISQWNPSLGRTLDLRAAFASVPLLEITLAAAVFSSALAFTGVRLRRLELASARHAGVTRQDAAGIAVMEVLIWLLPAIAAALIVLAVAASWQNPDPPLAAWLAGVRPLAAAAAAWLGTTAAATACVRERLLVRYFQQR